MCSMNLFYSVGIKSRGNSREDIHTIGVGTNVGNNTLQKCRLAWIKNRWDTREPKCEKMSLIMTGLLITVPKSSIQAIIVRRSFPLQQQRHNTHVQASHVARVSGRGTLPREVGSIPRKGNCGGCSEKWTHEKHVRITRPHRSGAVYRVNWRTIGWASTLQLA